jgi:hypothetical protein
MENEIINKVEQSGLVDLNLEDFYPKGERVAIDMKNYLTALSFGESKGEAFILKEKDFREAVKKEDWSTYKDKYIALICTADAIVPTWAYMLLAASLQPFANQIVFGNLATLELILFKEALSKINVEKYQDKRICIKGCGNLPVPESAYVEITRLLMPVAKSIMFGEACSTVPIMKRKE